MTDEDIPGQPVDQAPGEPSSPSLADKINFLFRTVYPAGRGPYSYAEAATGIEELSGERVSHTTLWKLCTGRATNPTKRLIEALAAFFQVSPAYFFDDAASKEIGDQVELLALLRDTGMKGAHLRAFFELSPEARDMVRELIERTARLEQHHRGK